MAGAIAVAPMVVGADPAPDTTSFLNRVEGGGFDHNRAHIRANPAPRGAPRGASACALRHRRRLARGQPGAVPGRAGDAHRDAWPPRASPAPTSGRSARPQPDGLWGAAAVDPLHGDPRDRPAHRQGAADLAAEVPDRDRGRPSGGNAYVWDPATNTSRSVPPPDVDYPSGPDRPGQPLVRRPGDARRRARAARGRQPRVPRQRRHRRGQRLQGRQVGHDLRPLDRDLDPVRRHAARALVPHADRAAPTGAC